MGISLLIWETISKAFEVNNIKISKVSYSTSIINFQENELKKMASILQ